MITDETFKQQIAKSPLPVMLFFISEACGPSYALEMLLEENFDDIEPLVNVMLVDIENCPNATRDMQVKGTPTLMILVDGQPVASRIGTQSPGQLLSWIKENIAKGA